MLLFLSILSQPLAVILLSVLAGGAGAAGGLLALEKHSRAARHLLRTGTALLLSFALFALADWALLAALPALRLSFSPDIRLPLMASLFVRLLLLWALLGAITLALRRADAHTPITARPALAFFLAVNLLFSSVQVYACVIEPLWLDTTRLTLTFDDLDPAAPPLRVVQIADPHIERSSHREAAVIAAVNELAPDLIVLTGDYLNLSYLDDPISAEDFRRFARQLHAPYGVYAVRGTVEPRAEGMARLLEGTDIIWLEQETVTLDVRGQSITLAGVACSHRYEADARRLEETVSSLAPDAFVLLLYHSPDLIHEAAALPVDLYLAGHTHGGQIRLPFISPPIPFSRYGSQYLAGLFREDGLTMYVSRGLGFEGGGLPRARFFSRPEIVVIELRGR
jgi:predicted MPP superfamily phosphohydrolase